MNEQKLFQQQNNFKLQLKKLIGCYMVTYVTFTDMSLLVAVLQR